MASQALEQMLEFAPSFGQTRMYETIDVYTAGTTVLYSSGKPLDPPGAPFGLPSPFEPASNYDFGGPGQARTIYPGLVERTRPAHEHEPYGLHSHREYHSIFNEPFTKPIQKFHDPLDKLVK